MVRSLVQNIAMVIVWQKHCGSYPTIELNIDELERLSLSPRQKNDVSRYVVVNADKMRETRREYKGWISGYSSLVPVPVGEFKFHAGRR